MHCPKPSHGLKGHSRAKTGETNKAADYTHKNHQDLLGSSVCHHLPTSRPQPLLLGQVCCDKPVVTHPVVLEGHSAMVSSQWHHVITVYNDSTARSPRALAWVVAHAGLHVPAHKPGRFFLVSCTELHSSHCVSPMSGSQQAQSTS